MTTPTTDRVDAFHRLGTRIPEGMTVAEAMEHAHMTGWNVRKTPLMARVPGGAANGYETVELPVAEKFVVVRDNPFTGKVQPLGVVGRKWTPFQNEASTGLLQGIVDEAEAGLTTVGVLGDGRKTFVSMKLPSPMEFISPVTGHPDITDLYLTVFNTHDGTGAMSVVLSPVRVMCANQQRMTERHARSRFSLRHTGNASAKLAEVRSMLGLTFKYEDVFAAECQSMIDREMAGEEVFAALCDVFNVAGATTEAQASRRTETASMVFEVYRQSDTVAPFRGTAFGAYNAVTEYADHYMRVRVRGGDDAQAQARAARSLNSAAVDALKGRAFDALVPA
jgi:phage/plasmid-like protein (TIGR03299 family)